MQKSETLYLTLQKKPFEATASGEKIIEVRKPSKWIMSRLKNKTYKNIKFTNGYNKNSQFVICEYQGWTIAKEKTVFSFSNGLSVLVEVGDVLISFGALIEMR